MFSTTLVGMALVACSSNNNNPPTVDGCTGHLCTAIDAPPGGVMITDPEGGNIIFEKITFDSELQVAFGLPAGVSTANRVMAYFMDAQTPNDNPLPTPGQCNNLRATLGWPLHVGNPHTDLDVGTLDIKGVKADGSAVDISVMKQPAGMDAIGRPHTIFYQAVNPPADNYVKGDTLYNVVFGGAGAIPATTFTGGIFLPADFTVNTPSLEDNGPLIGGTDYTVNWTSTTSTNLPTGDDVLGLTWLADTNGSPTHLCPAMGGAADNHFTIKGATIDEYKAIATAQSTPPTKVILLRQAVVHQLARLPNGEAGNQRRIDMLGISCQVQLMDVQ